MARLRYFFLSLFLFVNVALFGEDTKSSDEVENNGGAFDDLWENLDRYFYVVIIFVIMGYFLWRGQRLGKDD